MTQEPERQAAEPQPQRPRWLRALLSLTPFDLAWGACVLVLCFIAQAQVREALNFCVDDAYITFSYSKNLGTGQGPVFSHGLRVEGYSNFLWMVVVAIRYLFRDSGDPLGFAQFAAFACLGAMILAVYRLTRRAAGPFAALAGTLLLVCCSDLFRAAASGLETVPFAAAIVLGWAVYFNEPSRQRRWSLLAFLPAALLRIDGFVPMLVVFGVELLGSIGQRRFSLKALARWSLPAFAVWGLYFYWRYAYYGLPLPTTYYAKTVVALGDPDRGFRQGFDFVRDYGALALLPLAAFPIVRGPRRGEAIGLSLAVLLQSAHAVNVGGDWMPFNRFFLPIVPLAAVLVGWGVQQVWRISAQYAWPQRGAALVSLLGALVFACVHMHELIVDSPQEAGKLGNAQHVAKHTKENLLAVTDWIALVVRRPGERLVTDYAGVFSLFTDAEVIDMWGLCNADIALNGGTSGINPIYGKECAQCYARLKPDYFHVNVPMLRSETAFSNVAGVLGGVFQGPAIDRVISIQTNFAAGRVVREETGQTLWFLERRRPEVPFAPRHPKPGFRVDYPFEPGGARSVQ
jgi:arabinofuranosyltransferase